MEILVNNRLEISKRFLECEDSAVLITNRMSYGEFSSMVQNELGTDVNKDQESLQGKHYFQLEESNLKTMCRAIIHHLEQGIKNYFIDDLDNVILTHGNFRDDILQLEKKGFSFTVTDNNKLIK